MKIDLRMNKPIPLKWKMKIIKNKSQPNCLMNFLKEKFKKIKEVYSGEAEIYKRDA